jgi:hypothetical protein
MLQLRRTGEEEVQLLSFEALELEGFEWSALCPNRFTPWGKIPSFPLNKRTGALQGRCGVFGQNKNLVPLPGCEYRIVHPVAQVTVEAATGFRENIKNSF